MWSNNTKRVKTDRAAVFCFELRRCYVWSHQSFFFPSYLTLLWVWLKFVFVSVFCCTASVLLRLLNVSTDEFVPDPSLSGRFPLAMILHVWLASAGWLTACLLFLLLAVTFTLLCSFNSQFALFAVIFLSCLRALLSLAYSDVSVLALCCGSVDPCCRVSAGDWDQLCHWNVSTETIFLRTEKQPVCVWWLF